MATNTKHAPATPLPFSVENLGNPHGASTYVVNTPDDNLGRFMRIAEVVKTKDAAYLAHAANAYPKLVEALRELLNAEGVGDEKYTAARNGLALLRELGEAS